MKDSDRAVSVRTFDKNQTLSQGSSPDRPAKQNNAVGRKDRDNAFQQPDSLSNPA